MRDKAAQKRYTAERAKGKSIRKAAAAAKVSSATAFRAERDPAVKSAMARALERVAGGERKFEDKLASTVIDALDATKVISANVIAPHGEGMADAHGTTKDFIDVPDFQARIKAAELAGKFRGDFLDRVEHSGEVKLSFTCEGDAEPASEAPDAK